MTPDLLIASLQANAVFAALYLLYRGTLRMETWFTLRRAWLLGAAVVAVVLPLLPSGPAPGVLVAIELPAMVVRPATDAAASWSLTGMLVTLHVGVSALLILRLLFRIGMAFVRLRGPVPDAMTFLWMVRVPAQVEGDDARALRCHETVHARQGHTVDVLLFELLAALWWSNPLWWQALRELRLVHEHIADAEARQSHPAYDRLLLASALGTSPATLAHRFRSSNLEQRIAMMHNPRPARLARPKLLLVLPALLIAALLTSWRAVPVRLPAKAPQATAVTDPQPQFPGGQEALMQYLSRHLTYPQAAIEAKAQGNVIVGFLVRTDGSIADVTVKRGVHEALDREAVRVVSSMPNWEPAMVDGKAVNAAMHLPVAFVLD